MRHGDEGIVRPAQSLVPGAAGLGLKGQQVLRERHVGLFLVTLWLGCWAPVLKAKEKSRSTDGESGEPLCSLSLSSLTDGASTRCPMKQLPEPWSSPHGVVLGANPGLSNTRGHSYFPEGPGPLVQLRVQRATGPHAGILPEGKTGMWLLWMTLHMPSGKGRKEI